MNRVKKEEKKRGKEFPSEKLSEEEFNKLLYKEEDEREARLNKIVEKMIKVQQEKKSKL